MRYRLYVDEAGNPDLNSSEDFNHRFLGLTGVAINIEDSRNLVHPQLDALKTKFFLKHHHPDEPVILHRKELVNRRYPFESLKSDTIRAEFDNKLISLLIEWPLTVFSVCIDKKALKERYFSAMNPYHYSLEILMEKYCLFLKRSRSCGDIMFESRGGKEDKKLKDEYRNFYSKGTRFIETREFEEYLTTKELKIKPKSANIAGLQLADLFAHPCRQQLLLENKYIDSIKPFGKRLLQVISMKYDQKKAKIYGKKFIP